MYPSYFILWAELTARMATEVYAILFGRSSQEGPEPLVTNVCFSMVVMTVTMKTN